MAGRPASLYLFHTCHLYCLLPPADLVTRFQLFSDQLNDTMSPVGIAEHCFFIQLSWYDLPNRPCRGAGMKGCTIPIPSDLLNTIAFPECDWQCWCSFAHKTKAES